MEIPNLASNPQSSTPASPKFPQESFKFSFKIFVPIFLLALLGGFLLSRLSTSTKNNLLDLSPQTVSTENITNQSDIQVGVLYGDSEKTFKDSATGTIEKGSINGEGTHILNREGGKTQRASLTSSVVDLDLFVGKKVEVKGETNTSNKTAWLLDVGSIKVLE